MQQKKLRQQTVREYRLSRKAEHDLEDIIDYTSRRFGDAQAETYAYDLKQHFLILADNPNLAPERREFSPPMRLFPSGSHVIAYLDRGDQIEIIRILHSRMDILRHLG